MTPGQLGWGIANAVASMAALLWVRAAWSPPADLPLDSAPRIHLSAARLDLGAVKAPASAFGLLEVSNLGTGPLRFRVETTCACLHAHQPVESLPPGQECRVPVRFTMPYPGLHAKEIVILSNDASNPTIRLPVEVRVEP